MGTMYAPPKEAMPRQRRLERSPSQLHIFSEANGIILRKGEVFTYVGSIQNLKDVKVTQFLRQTSGKIKLQRRLKSTMI
jgi:hypothetical protein